MGQTRVLIADDESIIRMDLREMLTSLGYLVVGEAGDGLSAVNSGRELKPDLVIMDIKMPDLDGIAAAKILTEERIAPCSCLLPSARPSWSRVLRRRGLSATSSSRSASQSWYPRLRLPCRGLRSSVRSKRRLRACARRSRRASSSSGPRVSSWILRG